MQENFLDLDPQNGFGDQEVHDQSERVDDGRDEWV